MKRQYPDDVLRLDLLCQATCRFVVQRTAQLRRQGFREVIITAEALGHVQQSIEETFVDSGHRPWQ